MLLESQEEVRTRAERLAERLRPLSFEVELCDGVSLVGGGSAPGETIPTALLLISLPGFSASRLESRLRQHTPPVLARTENDRVVMDLRTVITGEEDAIFAALSDLASVGEPEKSRSGGDRD